MNRKNSITLLLLTFLIFSGCQKKPGFSEQTVVSTAKKANIPPKGFFIENRKVPGVSTSSIGKISFQNNSTQSGPDPDNGDEPVILGAQLANPYTVANMQQAVNTLYGGNYPISATHLYVRFKPASVEQFITLEESEDLELQDYPMDYEVIQDGDYYQDPNLGTEDFGWLYTVVPAGYNFPAGIQNELIDSLYLPEDNELLEDMAESMAGGAQYRSRASASNTVTIQRMDTTMETFSFGPQPCGCAPDAIQCPVTPGCEDGGGGGSGGNDPRIPRGTIEVQDVRVCSNQINNVPVRQARIVCKRWFKIERTYTNDQGQFVSSKKFKNKVKVNLKTKNQYANVRKIRGIRLWQILFPVKKRIGVFDQGTFTSIYHLFSKPNPTSAYDKELPYWVAVTTHNSVLEYHQYATELGVGQPPSNLKIIVTNWGFQRDAGAAPMWNKCSPLSGDFSSFREYIEFYLALSTYVSQVNLFGFLKNQMDVVIGYAALGNDYNCRLNSNNIKSIAYHELGHTSHFAQAGCGFWRDYRQVITGQILFGAAATKPYGDGNQNNAGLVAVGEMWGYHCGFIFTNRHYGNGGAFGGFGVGFTALSQGIDWPNNGGLNAYLNAVENFNPNLNNPNRDLWQWIPQGLPYDLFDDRNDYLFNPALPTDNVAGFTMQQCFNALQSDVRTIPAFRDRLLQQNAFSQQSQVNALFNEYNY